MRATLRVKILTLTLKRLVKPEHLNVSTGLSGISVYAVLLWTSSIEWVQVSQFLYGLYMATEVAYLTYIYAKVSIKRIY